MSETKTLLALFEDIDPAVAAIDRLRDMGIGDEQINVISGIPLTERMLGRPRQWSNVPRLAAGRGSCRFPDWFFAGFCNTDAISYPGRRTGDNPWTANDCSAI